MTARLGAQLLALAGLGLSGVPCAGVAVLTRSYDNERTGANTAESTLTPALVAARGLQLQKSLMIPDDPRIEAQPLYVPGIKMRDGKEHDVIIVASMGNHVYAFDAQKPSGSDLLWETSLGSPFTPPATQNPGPPPHRETAIDSWGINISWGVLSTPVIDRDAGLIYAVNWVAVGGKRVLTLHRLRLADGKETSRPQAGLPIVATMHDPLGQPLRDARDQPLELHPDQKQRAALLLVPLSGPNKTLFVAVSGVEIKSRQVRGNSGLAFRRCGRSSASFSPTGAGGESNGVLGCTSTSAPGAVCRCMRSIDSSCSFGGWNPCTGAAENRRAAPRSCRRRLLESSLRSKRERTRNGWNASSSTGPNPRSSNASSKAWKVCRSIWRRTPCASSRLRAPKSGMRFPTTAVAARRAIMTASWRICTRRVTAPSNLYHILLLREIGVDDQRLRAIATRGLRSFDIKSSFVEVGLLPASALKDPAVDAAVAGARAAANARTDPGAKSE